jgi:hypothetical protein
MGLIAQTWGLESERAHNKGLVMFVRLNSVGMTLRWAQLYVVADTLDRGVHMPCRVLGGLHFTVNGRTGGCSGWHSGGVMTHRLVFYGAIRALSLPRSLCRS